MGIEASSNFVVALIIAIVAIAILFYFLIKTIPSISKAVDSIIGGIKKPICCQMFQCGPASPNPICAAMCWGVCE